MITGDNLSGRIILAYRMVGVGDYHIESTFVSQHVDGELRLRDRIESLGHTDRIFQNDDRIFLTKEAALQDIQDKAQEEIDNLMETIETLLNLKEKAIMERQGVKE